MHILNRLRKLVKDISDTKTSKEDKVSYLENWTDFYNKNVSNLSTLIILPYDTLVYSLPEDFYSIREVKDLVTWDILIENEDYEIDTISKDLILIVKDLWDDEDYVREELKITYSTKQVIYTEVTELDIEIWENTVVVLDPSKFFLNQEVIISDSTTEEIVKITWIDFITSEVTFSCINTFLTWSTLFPDLRLLTTDKDIIVYYAANLIEEVNSTSTTSWSKTSWKQWEITYSSEDTSWTSVSSYMNRVNTLLKENLKSNLNLSKNQAVFTKTLIF